MIWAGLAVLGFLMVWLAVEIADELQYVWRNGRTYETATVAVLIVAVFAVAIHGALVAVDAVWGQP